MWKKKKDLGMKSAMKKKAPRDKRVKTRCDSSYQNNGLHKNPKCFWNKRQKVKQTGTDL